MNKPFSKIICLTLMLLLQLSCQREKVNQLDVQQAKHSGQMEDDTESQPAQVQKETNCKRASSSQVSEVNLGLTKLDQFLNKCYSETGSRKWCDQVARPNPESHSAFDCTYSSAQQHNFVHPDEKSWDYAVGAIKLVQELIAKGIEVDVIYNWWRPEPYNANVGGAAGRHPFGTSVDVRFPNKIQQNLAHAQLCKWRKQGRLRALGYYPGTGLHFGMGDKAANTWGRACP